MKARIKNFTAWVYSHNRSLLLVFFLAVAALFVDRFEHLYGESLQHQKLVGEALQPFAVSIGAVLSGAAAFNYLDEWLKKQSTRREEIRDWRRRFPISKLGKSFTVIQSNSMQGVLYIWDKKRNTKHWIVDPKTLRWMGLSYSDVKTLSEDDFNSINRGANIEAYAS